MAGKESKIIKFSDMGLSAPVLKALNTVGYETPTPIQSQTIAHMLNGEDVIGQAQTGTGKTAAFALPLLTNIDITSTEPQTLVLVPTRELAIQVAEAFQRYASGIKGLHVLPIYGGQDIKGQLRQLKRGIHVVVGTPGRVMDHMRRGSLKLNNLKCLVLDEADEMLRMGFIDDVKWVLEQTPANRQIALFSATMPEPIKRIAQKYLSEPKEIFIKMKTTTAENINQRYWMVDRRHKLDVLTRILEAETFDGVLIFVRTKTESVTLVDRLEARGYASSPLNGDIKQSQREKTVKKFKDGGLDILVATDVAARGLDVERISLVINYDMPFDIETYIHRIGRTGRAGRSGEAILFAAPREKRMLRSIENATGQLIDRMKLPSNEDINDKRISEYKQRITDTIEKGELKFFRNLVEQYRKEHDIPSLEIAAALAKLVQGEKPMLLAKQPELNTTEKWQEPERKKSSKPKKAFKPAGAGMQRYRIEVGKKHNARPNNIVGAIANEAGIAGKDIRNIDMDDFHSYLDLPADLPTNVMQKLAKIWICEKKTNISIATGDEELKSGDSKRSGFRRKRQSATSHIQKPSGKMKHRKKSKKKK